MDFQIEGMIGTMTLGAGKHLLPVFEAIVNSIQAIAEAKEKKGLVDVRVIRDTQQKTLANEDKAQLDVVGFEITDNGVGFNESNFKSFDTSFSTYKASQGGKGVGRFVWLVAFQSASVESHFLDEKGNMRRRTFAFVPKGRGVESPNVSDSSEKKRTTTVKLQQYKEKYRKACPKKLETIAAKIIENCLEYLLRSDCPRLLLTDTATGQTIKLNDEFNSQVIGKAEQVDFDIKGESFLLRGLKLSPSHAKEHVVHYCADERVVKSEKLKGRVDDLAKTLVDDKGNNFVYAGYVSSKVLNSQVTQDRTDFAIDEESDGVLKDTLDWKVIRQNVENHCAKQLSPYTISVAKEKDKRIEQYIETEGPMYRPVMKYIAPKIRRLDPEISPKNLDIELYKAMQDVQVDLKEKGAELLNAMPTDGDFEGYAAKVKEYFDKVSDLNQADLARYVCHRRAVLDFLHNQLSRQHDGKYSLEECVHDVVFPRHKTSNEVPFHRHQLWLVDEKLVYHRYLASDKALKEMDVLVSTSKKEPDIAVFNVFDKACALVNEPDAPFGSVVVVEFKRPMRKDYADDDNPIQQVYNYVREVRDGKALLPGGRPVEVKPGVPFYCYVICDLTEKLRKQIELQDLSPMPDGQGFFYFHKKLNAYIEVISYTKMITDAKKRNAVFFDMLKLPTSIDGS